MEGMRMTNGPWMKYWNQPAIERGRIKNGNLPTHFYWRGFRMCRSHTHRHSQSRSRTAATPTITLRMILRTGPLLGPNSIIPGLPEANAACKEEIGPRGRLFSRCENFFLSELDEPLLTEFNARSVVSFSKARWKNACLARSANPTAFISCRSIRPDTVRNSRWLGMAKKSYLPE